MSLESLQKNFQEYLFTGNNIPAIKDGFGASVKTRLGIYHSAFRIRIYDALMQIFPKVLLLIGEEEFYKASTKYLQSNPSTYYTLDDIGNKFPGYLLELYPKQIFIGELADFELSLANCLVAADAKAMTLKELKAIAQEDWPDLKFKLHPSVCIKSYSYNVGDIWSCLNSTSINAATNIIKIQRSIWLLWHFAYQSNYFKLDNSTYVIIQAIKNGQMFSDICISLLSICAENVVSSVALRGLVWLVQNRVLTCF